jgi:hypothetical protein
VEAVQWRLELGPKVSVRRSYQCRNCSLSRSKDYSPLQEMLMIKPEYNKQQLASSLALRLSGQYEVCKKSDSYLSIGQPMAPCLPIKAISMSRKDGREECIFAHTAKDV